VPDRKPIHLSPPDVSDEDRRLLLDAFDSNWIAPLGPHVDAFESEFAARIGVEHAVALSSGTAALHLALLVAGVGAGDQVAVSSFTFVASVNPIRYVGAEPVLIDSEPESWNMDPHLLDEALARGGRAGRLPAAVVVVHLYGQSANLEPILAICARHGVPVIEDAAESLGTTHSDGPPGTFGRFGVFSFNGNKIITTSGGGMLVTRDGASAERVRKLATQARDRAPHYEHSELGFNYRLSNLCAALGRGQLRSLDEKVETRRRNFEYYRQRLSRLPGVAFQPEASWGRHSRWLTCLLVSPAEFGATSLDILRALEREAIEARPLWKPMHLQPLYRGVEMHGGGVSEELFTRGLCLPSGSTLRSDEMDLVIEVIERVHSGP
jgi:dTDP-4-amino-4,6-dideoxygalactose transaminase